MPVIINGSTGISGTDGSAGTPAVQGTDTNTGMFFPAADTIAFAEGGTEVLRINSDAQLVVSAGTVSLPSITATGDTNTGMFFPAADTIAFAEGGVEAVRMDSSGNLQFNSGYGSVATAYGCRAWVNFNGTGTVAIRASGNVSSITDNAQSEYTVNFTTAMPDANYCVATGSATDGGNQAVSFQVFPSGAVPTTSSVRVKNYTTNTGQVDSAYCYVAIFR
jgi:hypothetical protein